MSIGELALLITTLSGAIAAMVGAIVALMKTRTDSELGRHERDELRQESAEQKKQIEKLEGYRVTDRRDIILIGESLAQARSDNAIMAEAFNQIWSEFYRATGHKPEANLEALKRLQTIHYITGPLGPLNVEP
jgi:hypothetical protein